MVISHSHSDRAERATARHLAGPAAVVRAALSQPRLPAHQVAEHLAALVHMDGALALRRAMVLAWIRQRDVTDLGYSSFGAFVRERVDASASWERALRRLVESPLDQVKAALCQGRVRLRDAVRAPAECTVGGQTAWLEGLAPGAGTQPRAREWVEGERAEVVRRGRHRARLLLGRAAPDEQVDDRMLAWQERDVPADVLLDKALAPREAPPRVELSWGWCVGDPTEALLGRWAEPVTLRGALAQLEQVQAVTRARRTLLAHAWAIFCHETGWAALGYASARAFASAVLDWSSSTEARYRKLGWRLK